MKKYSKSVEFLSDMWKAIREVIKEAEKEKGVNLYRLLKVKSKRRME